MDAKTALEHAIEDAEYMAKRFGRGSQELAVQYKETAIALRKVHSALFATKRVYKKREATN